MKIRIKGKYFSWSDQVKLISEETQEFIQRRRIQLKNNLEITNSQNFIYVIMDKKGFENRNYAFYAEVLICNNTPFELWISGKTTEEEILERQKIGVQEILASFSEAIEINDNGKDVSLNGFSAQSVEIFVKTGDFEEKMDLIIETKPLKLGFLLYLTYLIFIINLDEIHSSILVLLTPKYILINNFIENIFYKQTISSVFELTPKARKVLTWDLENKG